MPPAPTKLENACLIAQSVQNNVDLVLRRRGLAGPAANVLDQFVSCVFRSLLLLHHFDLLIDKMNQKSSVVQILKSDLGVLTSDKKTTWPRSHYGFLASDEPYVNETKTLRLPASNETSIYFAKEVKWSEKSHYLSRLLTGLKFMLVCARSIC